VAFFRFQAQTIAHLSPTPEAPVDIAKLYTDGLALAALVQADFTADQPTFDKIKADWPTGIGRFQIIGFVIKDWPLIAPLASQGTGIYAAAMLVVADLGTTQPPPTSAMVIASLEEHHAALCAADPGHAKAIDISGLITLFEEIWPLLVAAWNALHPKPAHA
jgi:hypothetical protein